MKKLLIILTLSLTLVFAEKQLSAQIIDIKPWHGTYPDMEGTYPLTFIAFKGSLIPIPHEFIRIWPTHYYMEVVAEPTYDTGEYASLLKINLLKIAEKLIQRQEMKGRQQETRQIRDNTQMERDMEKKIFDANSDQLPDIYNIASGFIRLYASINRLDNLNKINNCSWLKPIYQKQADELLTRFITVNLLRTEHGKKLEAFAEIQKELNQQIGETDYTYRKVHHYLVFTNDPNTSYTFLTE